MTIAVYEQRMTKDRARIGRFTDDVLSSNFGKYFLDVVSHSTGISVNNHGVKDTKDKAEIEEWLTRHNFILVEE